MEEKKEKMKLRLRDIEQDIKADKVTRKEMDFVVHESLCEKKDERRKYAEFLLDLALKRGAELSEGEMKEIEDASKSQSQTKQKAIKEISNLSSMRMKYKTFMKKIKPRGINKNIITVDGEQVLDG